MAVKKRKNRRITAKMQKKLLITFMLTVAALIYLSVVLIKINASKGKDYSKSVYNNYNYTSRTIAARRGDITDRNGTVLAYSTKEYNLIIDAKVLLSKSDYKEPTIKALLQCFDIDEADLRSYIQENEDLKSAGKTVSSYKRYITGLTADEIEEFNELMENNDYIKGVWFEDEYERVYPYGTFACDVLGFASKANGGEIGLESYYDSELSGTDGREYGYIDDSSYSTTRKNATNGNTLVTTLDYNIQSIIEESIAEFNETYGSASTSVIVMDPNNGEILGMADYPAFDLNDPRDLTAIFDAAELNALDDEEMVEKMYSVWSNYCVSSIYEPGSVFKTFTIAEALEEGIEELTDTFDCDGVGVYNSSKIYCHGGNGHGELTLGMALGESCNDALMSIGMDIGAETFAGYFTTYNLGIKTEIDLPSEEAGLLYEASEMMDVDLATNAFGQNLNVTMVQMISTFASIINGGYYYRPHLVKTILSDSGDVENIQPEIVTQTISSETSAIMREMLRAVVDYGTGGYVHLDGYSIGGKTGTAEKAGRTKDEYVISFMGFAPAENPEVLVYVVIDTPDCANFDSSWSAQMLSRDIFKKLLPYLGIERDNAEYDYDIPIDADDLEEMATALPYDAEAVAAQEANDPENFFEWLKEEEESAAASTNTQTEEETAENADDTGDADAVDDDTDTEDTGQEDATDTGDTQVSDDTGQEADNTEQIETVPEETQPVEEVPTEDAVVPEVIEEETVEENTEESTE